MKNKGGILYEEKNVFNPVYFNSIDLNHFQSQSCIL